MIDPHAITCSSELYDSCGVVFGYKGEIFRALYPRGKWMFDLLAKDGWMDRLVSLGLVRMDKTDLALPGYEAIIKSEKVSPIIPPMKWSTGMLCEAGQVLCALNQELLTRRLLIWDLKDFSNMAFCGKRGPVFLDLGAIHSVEELERKAFGISDRSLLDQIASSFYAPLWLTIGRPGKLQAAKRFAAYRRRGKEAFSLPAAVLRRITFEWMTLPGLWRGRRLLRAGRYEEFFGLIAERLQTWSTKLSTQIDLPAEWEVWTESAKAEHARIISVIEQAVGGLSDKTFLDLSPNKGYGLKLAEKTNATTYLVTHSEREADAFFTWRQKTKKPILPVVCNIWDRTFKPAFALRASADVVFILPSLFETAHAAQVPLDLVGRVASTLTRRIAVIGISNSEPLSFPAFLSPPTASSNVVDFARKTIGKYFKRQELIESPSQETALVVFHK
jgi:hypothetical protein